MEKQRKQSRRESWLAKVAQILAMSLPKSDSFFLPAAQGIVVKVMHEGLGDKYYRKKGVIENIKDEFTAIVQMLDTKDKLKIDQSHLETVIPAIGEQITVF